MKQYLPTAGTIDFQDTGTAHTLRSVELRNRYLRWAQRKSPAKVDTLELDPPYQLNIIPSTSWLPDVERRIQDSMVPNEYKLARSETEWLSEDTGVAALNFFQNTADILPAEPFLYGSNRGALVAEFKAASGTLTAIISPNEVIVFAVTTADPTKPIQLTVPRGSNSLRDTLRDLSRGLAGKHGVATSR
jgi:hypothetical protein